MKIHSDTLTRENFREIIGGMQHVTAYRFGEKGSRSRRRGFDLILSGSGRMGGQWGGDYQSATFDQWGDVIGQLFALDPFAIVGPYIGANDFHFRTGSRYAGLDYTHHAQHRWIVDGWTPEGDEDPYTVLSCAGSKAHGVCGATFRNYHRPKDHAQLMNAEVYDEMVRAGLRVDQNVSV